MRTMETDFQDLKPNSTNPGNLGKLLPSLCFRLLMCKTGIIIFLHFKWMVG